MVLEIIAGAIVGGAVGYFGPQLLIKLEQKSIRERARARIEKQDYDYYYKTNRKDKQVNKVDLKKIIKNSDPGSEPIKKSFFLSKLKITEKFKPSEENLEVSTKPTKIPEKVDFKFKRKKYKLKTKPKKEKIKVHLKSTPKKK